MSFEPSLLHRAWRNGAAFMCASALLLPVATAAGDATASESLERLQRADARLASVVYRLAAANAVLCDSKMPGTGLVIQALNQYPLSAQPAARQAFGFVEPVSVEAVVSGSPAQAAGIMANDGISALASLDLSSPLAKAPTSEDRDRIEHDIAGLRPDAPIPITLSREGRLFSLLILPYPICRVRFEIVAGSDLGGQTDGETIQLGEGFVSLVDDEALAVVASHELAHAILHHRQRLEAAGVSKGLLSELGRNLQLNRKAERDADRLSVYLLASAGYDPEIAPRYWDGPGKKADLGIFRSRIYAAPKVRAQAMRREIGEMRASGASAGSLALYRDRFTPLTR